MKNRVQQQLKEAHAGVDSGGTLRAAVFGLNDGLVANTSLIFGVAGATQEPHVILITGIAGLLAGSFSMAAGEYISMQAQRELFEREIAIESRELREDPQGEVEELARIYHKRGLAMNEARKVAKTMMRNHHHALDTHAREELGLNPQELGSPLKAAGSSFIAFALGAFIPLAPFLVLSGTFAMLYAAILALMALFGVGALLGKFTMRNPWWSGLRMTLIGAAAAVVTHVIGIWLGTAVG